MKEIFKELKNKSILITGAHGFLGHHVVRRLKDNRAEGTCILTPTREHFDLLKPDQIEYYLKAGDPNIVIHLAGTVGGIGLNKAEPGRLTYENLMMGLNLIEACRNHPSIEKFVCIGTTCSFAADCPIPFKEEDFLEFNRTGFGMPEITNAGYGLGKRMLYEVLRNYNLQYNFPFIYLIPVNLCGPHDHFEDHKSHVIPALIKKFHYAKINSEPTVTLWGDGSPTREFLYVEDAAKAIVKATVAYDSIYPLNLGNGNEISIFDLANKISDIVNYQGQIIWDENQPNGQMRRCMDVTRMKKYLGDICTTVIDEALQKTHSWYLENAQT
jgi:GDP-L-fucose synthase